MSEPLFSVVIPSRDNRERLLATLDSIARADIDMGQVQVIVVDDGSSDGTAQALAGRSFPFAFAFHRGEYANQSAATNEAIRRATGRYVLGSASDILFDRNLFAEHLAWHERFPGEDVAVLGHLPYAPNLEITPFMFYLVTGGFQFAYYLIRDPLRVPPNFLYAPNFSVRREVLERVGPFDVQFPFGSQDTDLGIRLVRAGVRIVYNAQAIGYHNHPVEFEGFFRRQVLAGRSLVRLEAKHPDHEGGPSIVDAVLAQYLAVSSAEVDAVMRCIESLEREIVSSRAPYRELWTRAFVGREVLSTFSDEERRVLLLARKLFQSYNRVLQFYWARGYLEESVELHGPERVRELLEARLHRSQTSVQQRRVIEHRAGEHALPMNLVGERDYLMSLVVHGIEDYAGATRYLAPLLDPETMRYNLQIVLVIARDACSAEELAKLRECADVEVADALDAGVLAALAGCRGELAAVASCRVPLDSGRAHAVARKVFARWPRLAVLGGGVDDPAAGRRVIGYRLDGSATAGTREPGAGGPGFEEIEVCIPDYCLIRTAFLPEALERAREAKTHGDEPWNVSLCRAAREAGYRIFHLPDLTCEDRTGPPGVARVV